MGTVSRRIQSSRPQVPKLYRHTVEHRPRPRGRAACTGPWRARNHGSTFQLLPKANYDRAAPARRQQTSRFDLQQPSQVLAPGPRPDVETLGRLLNPTINQRA